MNILELHDNPTAVFDTVITNMQQSGSGVYLGNNPSLSLAVQEAYGWPGVFMRFIFNKKILAYATANKVQKNEWFSLPHFNHGGLWVNQSWWEKHYNELNAAKHDEAHQIFYKLLILAIEKIPTSDTKYRCFEIELFMDDLSKVVPNAKVKRELKFGCRSEFRLLDYHLGGKVIPCLSLSSSVEEQMKAFSVGVRRKIRKSQRNGLVVKTGGSELLDDFMKVYDHNIRALGSFGMPRKFFRSLLLHYAHGLASIVVVYHNQKAVGAAILLTFLDFAENPWFATVRDYNHLYVSYALHHQMITESINAGCRTYSFGRSTRDSSVHRYKKQWGTNDETLFVNTTYKNPKISHKRFLPVQNLVRMIPNNLARKMDMQVSRHIF